MVILNWLQFQLVKSWKSIFLLLIWIWSKNFCSRGFQWMNINVKYLHLDASIWIELQTRKKVRKSFQKLRSQGTGVPDFIESKFFEDIKGGTNSWNIFKYRPIFININKITVRQIVSYKQELINELFIPFFDFCWFWLTKLWKYQNIT